MKKLFILLSIFLSCNFKPAFSQIDPLEFPPGHPNVTVTAIEQLQSFPVPRYKPGHTLMHNYNVMDPIYFGGYKQPGVTDATAIANSVEIQKFLCKDFHYMFNVNWFNNDYSRAAVDAANANPSFKIAAMTLRAQTTGGTKLWNQEFSNDHYIQDAQGRFMGWGGEIVSYPYKVWRPVSTWVNDYAVDGDIVRNAWAPSIAGLNRNVDFVNEDGEVYPLLDAYPMDQDPVVKAARIASGLPQREFLARQVRINDNEYRDKFMVGKFAGAFYTGYRYDGHRGYQFPWSEAKFINSQIKGQYYSTPDLYVRWPNNWKDWVSAWHGLRWVTEGRYYEISQGDFLFSPFVAAGWDENPEVDVRPAQWLGLMKVMGMYGAEFYYTSYFVEYLPANDPKGYAWQTVIPPYSQAISSRYEDILRNGSLLAGDMINNQHTDEWGTHINLPLYQFSCNGKTNYVVVIRKHNTLNKYAITATIQNSSNQIGSAPLSDDAQITLNGQTLKFKIRRQGSTYIYDLTGVPVFYQLDGWHEYKHPSYWSQDFEIEGENFDSGTGTGTVKTYAAGTDFRSFQSVVSLSNNQVSNYSINNRSAGIKYLFVKAAGTGSCETTFDGNKQTSNVSNGWFKVSLGNVSNGPHQVELKSLSNLEIDSISVTSNPNKYPVTTCVPPSAVISASNTDPCNGDTVLLSASTGASYLWSDSHTTQTISVFNNATYTVTVSNGQCSSASAPYAVSFRVCSSCRAPSEIQILNVMNKNFTIVINRVAEADSGYTVHIRDLSASTNLPDVKRKQSQPSNQFPQIKCNGLKSRHTYEVFVVSNCKGMDSEMSTKIQITTKGNTVAKLSQR